MGKAAKKQGLRRSQEDRDRVRAERQLSGSIEEEIETKRASLRRKLSSGKILGSLGRVPDINDATIKCACIFIKIRKLRTLYTTSVSCMHIVV